MGPDRGDLHVPPPPSVREAFGRRGEVEPLSGGEGVSWRCEDVVFKPVPDDEAATWCAEVLTRLDCEAIVVPRPIADRDGRWVLDGWTCTEFVPARRRRSSWLDIIEAGRAFHALVAGVPRPAWMDRRSDRWRRADEVAWGDRPPIGGRDLVELVNRLRALRRPVDLGSQIIHGDLCGNVLFDARGTPVLLDFSPYWRPSAWATAIVAIDAREWEGAGRDAVHWLDDVEAGHQLLLRAAIFRISTSAERAADHGPEPGTYAVHRATVELLEGILTDEPPFTGP